MNATVLLAAGAAGMYLLDPQQGPTRRQIARDRAKEAKHMVRSTFRRGETSGITVEGGSSAPTERPATSRIFMAAAGLLLLAKGLRKGTFLGLPYTMGGSGLLARALRKPRPQLIV
jgi:hypothetical protein